MTKPIYANITIQTDNKETEIDQEYLKTLTKEKRVKYIRSMEKTSSKTIQLKGIVLPSDDLNQINLTCLKRIAKQGDLDHNKIKVIKVDKFRVIDGTGLYYNDWTRVEV